uniref:Uncharacterized protein n=1 Tax=Myoviridae sp. ct1Js5 TaxID=2826601 RepID=A0A8S5M9K8_9CAUD|nr:MAG TPA: hypothetical protein [Myoviridae sp. ct1Js5]
MARQHRPMATLSRTPPIPSRSKWKITNNNYQL